MRERFTRGLEVPRAADEVWRTLLDVPLVASWITIVGAVEEVAPLERYRAVLEDRLGPFRLRADLDIQVTGIEPGRRVTASARGEDRQVASRIAIEATLSTEPRPSGTAVALDGHFEVTGRVAALGATSIRKKAERVLEDFFGRAAATLGA
jgi:uncharacterized protein